MNRKEFFKTACFLCMGGSMAGIVLQSCGTSNYYAKTTLNNKRISIPLSEFVSVDKNNQKIMRKYVLVKNEQLNFPICIYRISEREYSALYLECTHSSCELNPQGDYLQCPCHGSEFSNKGVVQNPPAENNLKTFITSIENENLLIQL
jgi:Rieske Fe-S protein